MDGERRVVLYGDTVVLAGVGRALATHRGLRVISLDPSRPTVLHALDDLRPCAVIVDLTVVTAESALALLRGRPDLLVIGLEPGGERLLVLSGEWARGLTTEGLVRLIETGAPAVEGNGHAAGGAGRQRGTVRQGKEKYDETRAQSLEVVEFARSAGPAGDPGRRRPGAGRLGGL